MQTSSHQLKSSLPSNGNDSAAQKLPTTSFKVQSGHLGDTMSQLKWKLNMLSQLKHRGAKANDQQVRDLDQKVKQMLLTTKSGMRNVIEMVDVLKKNGSARRNATDDHNLTLQSHLYEISHYKKQIYACQEFSTPELDKVIDKAMERAKASG